MKKLFISIILIFISVNFIFAKLNWVEVVGWQQDIFRDIDCIDSNNCLAHVGYEGFCKLNKTTDGGETWFDFYNEHIEIGQGNPFPNPQFSYSFEYVDENHFFIGFEKGHIRSTNDGGTTYDTLVVSYKYKNDNLAIYEISMLDSLFGISSSGALQINYTTDGWRTYNILKSHSIDSNSHDLYRYIYDISIHNQTTVSYIEHYIYYSYSDTSAIYYCKTDDLGETWQKSLVYDGKRFFVMDVEHINDSLIFMCGNINVATSSGRQIDVIYKSTDAGNTWEINYWKHPDDQEIDFGLVEMAFLDENNGIVTGQYGKVLRTTDGGETWLQDYIADDSPVLRVEYASKQAIIGTFDGRVFLLKDDGTSVATQSKTELQTYPNPFYESVTISFPEFMRGTAKIEIYNSVGVLIEQTDFTIGGGEMVFTPNADVPGVYFYRITHGGEIYEGSFVKLE